MSKVLLLIKGIGTPRNNAILRTSLIVILALLAMTVVVFASYSDNVNKSLADNLIRLHVVANSDSPEDQALKRDVRDVIIEYMKGQLKDSRDIAETKYIIERDMPKLEELARNEIARQGKSYSVKASLGSYTFPTKLYGDITLPAGKYEALKIIIGNGEGANWWCVLFPPLCFVDATHGTVPDSVKSDLKNVLSEDEYQLITTADKEEDIPIKVKFKVVEFFQDSKIKFSGMISRIFN